MRIRRKLFPRFCRLRGIVLLPPHCQLYSIVIVTNTPFLHCFLCDFFSRSEKKDVLAAAQGDIFYFHQSLLRGDNIPKTAATSFRQYCEAILLITHKLTGKEVMGLSVSTSSIILHYTFVLACVQINNYNTNIGNSAQI